MAPRIFQVLRILSFGYVADRLQQRNELLQQAGFVVDEAIHESQALRLAASNEYIGLVIGASVEHSIRNQLAQAVRIRNPHAIVVMLYESSIEDTELADAVLNRDAGDQELPQVMLQLLMSRCGANRSAALH
jgi:PleD family two-component response regulator